MAVVLSVNSRQYNAGASRTVNPTFPAGASSVRLTLTGPNANWPAGVDYTDPETGQVYPNTVFVARIARPNGEPGGVGIMSGGVITDRNGVPLVSRFVQSALQASRLPLDASWGPYDVTAEVLVTLTASITVERF